MAGAAPEPHGVAIALFAFVRRYRGLLRDLFAPLGVTVHMQKMAFSIKELYSRNKLAA